MFEVKHREPSGYYVFDRSTGNTKWFSSKQDAEVYARMKNNPI